jgi:diguanylate cyclase (GGDEF)-like protein
VLIQFLLVLVVMLNALSVLGVLALFWRRGGLARRPALSALAAATFLYAFGYGLELAGATLEWKRYALAVQYLGITALGPLLLTVAASFAGARWLARTWIRATAWVAAAVGYASVVTSQRHDLFYARLDVAPAGPLLMLDLEPGPVYVALQAFVGITILVANVVLVRAWRRAPARERGPMATLMVASSIPWIANLAYLAGLVPWRLDGPPFFLLPIAALFAWSVRDQGLVELRPIARDEVVERLRDPVVVADLHGRIVDANAAGEAFLDHLEVDPQRPGAVLGRYPALASWTAIASHAGASERQQELAVDGRTFRVRPVSLHDRRGRASGLALVFHDVSSYERMHRNLERLATTDALTDLPNRRRFFEVARRWIAREGAAGVASGWLVIDVDHFKQVNDRYGHDAGDRVLRAVAAALLGAVRGGDVVARMGGEEFAVFLPGAERTAALTVAERLRAAVASAQMPVAGVRVTVSVGACARPGGTIDLDEVLAEADAALYRAKAGGRDRVAVAPDERVGAAPVPPPTATPPPD